MGLLTDDFVLFLDAVFALLISIVAKWLLKLCLIT